MNAGFPRVRRCCRWAGRAAATATSAALLLLAIETAPAGSEPASSQPPKVRILFVDADHPSTWPKALEPTSAGELRKLLDAVQSSELDLGSAQIEHATYSATFRDGALRDGNAELVLGKVRHPCLVCLEHPNLEFAHLQWAGAPNGKDVTFSRDEVLYGIDRLGRRVVIAQPGHSRLSCDWMLAGHTSLGATEFGLSLPPAVVSEVTLRLPSELSLECDQGVFSRIGQEPDGKAALWRIELGSRSTCRLRIIAPPSPGKARTFYDQDTTFIVAADRLRVQTKMQIETFGAPLRTLRLSVPAGVRLETVSFGDDFPLVPPATSSDKDRVVSLDLPEPIFGKGRTILIEASTSTVANRPWNLPQIELQGALLREGQSQLTIRAPLKLVRFGGVAGLTQSEAPTYSIDGETFVLRRNASDSPLQIEIREPAPALAARTLGRLALRRDRCTFAADVVCSANGGSTFSVAFELPESWDVTRIEAVGDVSRMIDETTRPTPEHRKRVKIDFFRAVTDREPKRFRVEATRALPRSGETIDLPVMEFPGFASQEVETLVVYNAPIELTLNPAEAFAAFDPAAILSVLPDSPLRPDRSAAADAHMLAHRWNAQSAKAQITLRHGDEGVQAKVQSTVEVDASQISERFDVTIVPASPLDRLFVYLSAEASSPSWQLVAERSRPLEGTRVVAAGHPEWNLPDGGQLWEIRLPEPLRKEFHLHGTWRTSLVGGTKVALPLIAGARSFEGLVELSLHGAPQSEVEALGPRPAGTSSGGMQRFRYDRPADALVVRPRVSGVAPREARFASLRLTSFLNAAGNDDLHHADFSIAPLLTSQPFHFQLDSASRLCSVAVNGALVRIERRGDDVVVPALPADAWNRVQVEYKTNAPVGLFRENRLIDIPRPQGRVLAFRWCVLLAPGLQPGASPTGLSFAQPLPGLSWPERIFGPLGQSRAQMRLSLFKPDPWILDSAAPDSTDDWILLDPQLPAPGWKSWQASVEEIPAKVTLTIWHAGAIRTLAWIICLGSLTGWLAVVRLAPSLMRRCVPYAVAASAALALAAPAPYALFAGAVVSATLLAFLLSCSWNTLALRRANQENPAHHQGSTITFEARTAGLLLVLATFGTMAVFAQDAGPVGPGPRPLQARPAESETRRPQPSTQEDLLVVIPVHQNRARTERLATLPVDRELVYLAPTAIDSLRRRAATISRNEGVAFLSSDYRIALDQRQPATIEATYRVAVIAGVTQQVWLPLSNVTLAGADACHVDGRAFPIRREDGGFVLSLKPDKPSDSEALATSADSPPGSRRPIVAEPPQVSSSVERPPHIYEIRLACFPASGASPARFEIQVPQTVHTAVRISQGSAWPVTIIETDEGKPRQLHPGDPAVDVGQTEHIRIKAGSGPTETNSGIVAAHAVQFWRVSPGLVEMDCRVAYDREDRSIEKFTWLVPAGASIRASGEGYRAALRDTKPTNGTNTSAATGLVPLDFDCSAAPDGPLTLAARLLLPIGSVPSTPGASFTVPLPQFAPGEGDPTSVTVNSNQLGISAVSGYRVIAATTDPNLSHTSKADPTFRQESFGARKEPDLIFDCQGISSLAVKLDAVVPTHKVRVTTHEARVSADGIRWKTTAEIRTENAPAFVHVLKVDRRLKIDSVSVREDDVERLVRFSQSGDAVTLFLRDRAAATQDLVLTGHLPLERGRSTKLPAVNLEHGVASDVHLAISHDPDLDIAVTDTPGVMLLRSKGNGDAASARPEVLEYSIAAGAPMPEIRVSRRSGTARVVPPPPASASQTAKPTAANPKSSADNSGTGQPAAHVASALVELQKRRVETVITLDLRSDGSAAGSADVLLERLTEPTFRLSWPASFELRGALLDGRPIQPLVGDGQISLSVPTEPVVHRLALHWESRSSSSFKVLARIREELPVPRDSPVDHVLISVAVPSTFHVWAPAHFTPLDSQSFARLRDNVQSADREARSFDAPSVGTTESRTIGQLAISGSGARFSAWAIDTFWLRFPLAAAIFALIAITAFQPYAVRAGNWLLSNPPLTLAAVGIIWCFCLTPRVIGLFALIAAIAILMADKRRHSSRSRALPSTLHTPGALESR